LTAACPSSQSLYTDKYDSISDWKEREEVQDPAKKGQQNVYEAARLRSGNQIVDHSQRIVPSEWFYTQTRPLVEFAAVEAECAHLNL
jgi:hypothetical protein